MGLERSGGSGIGGLAFLGAEGGVLRAPLLFLGGPPLAATALQHRHEHLNRDQPGGQQVAGAGSAMDKPRRGGKVDGTIYISRRGYQPLRELLGRVRVYI